MAKEGHIQENNSNLLIRDYYRFGLTLQDLMLLDELDRLILKKNKTPFKVQIPFRGDFHD